MIKIAMVDDHYLLREALGKVINGFDGCHVILMANNGEEFIQNMEPANLPDLVILDIGMPEKDGYQTADWLQENYKDIRILVLSMYASELVMLRMIQFGARGFLLKDIHPDELKRAIFTTIETGYYYKGGVIHQFLKHVDAKDPALNGIMTKTELEFLKHASTEMTYKEIAQIMKVSPRTIDNYRDSLFKKLGIENRAGLVLYAMDNGVIWPRK